MKSAFDGLGDWRIRAVTTIAAPIPQAFPGGPSHATGTPGYLSSLVKIDEGDKQIGFTTPSPVALCLSIAFWSATETLGRRNDLTAQSVVSPKGMMLSITHDKLPSLFDVFEHFFVCVQFSYSALECFANGIIGEELKTSIHRPDREGILREVPPEEAERLSLADKLATIIPDIRKVPSPKGRGWWQDFKALEDLRHSMVHWKSKHHYPGQNVDGDSPFFYALNRDPLAYPRLARAIVQSWYERGKEPRWLRLILSY